MCAKHTGIFNLVIVLNFQKRGLRLLKLGKLGVGFAKNKGSFDRHVTRALISFYYYFYQCPAASHFEGRCGPPFEKACSILKSLHKDFSRNNPVLKK